MLFLDEIGELPLDVQGDLLRFLEDGSFRHVGSTVLRRSPARIVAATNVDLDDFVRSGRFRRDLLARLRASNPPLELPPLRKRPEDIIGWTRRFAIEAAGTWPTSSSRPGQRSAFSSIPGPKTCASSAVWSAHSSPAPEERLPPDQLPERLRAHRKALRGDDRERPSSAAAPVVEPGREEIEAALEQTGGRMRTAAQLLGIKRRKLYRLCERSGIDIEHHRRRRKQI